MGRYERHKTDKAEALEAWIHAQAKIFSDSLQGAEVVECNLVFQTPFKAASGWNYVGFVSVIVSLEKKAPEFLTTKDEIKFWLKMREMARSAFGVETDAAKTTSYTTISFREDSEEALYALNEKKEAIFTEGLERIKQYVKWHQDCVRRYEETVKDEHDRKMNFFLNVLMEAT